MSIQSLLSSKQYGLKKVLEKLIAHRLDQDVMRVLAHLDHEISDEDMQWIQKSYHSYAVEKQPLEYILGFVEFLGNRFMVDRNTLIPRPETEYMIEAVLKNLTPLDKGGEGGFAKSTLIDVGTGCGVLGLSCILHGAGYLNQVYLTEFYPETLEVARRNREKYKQSCQLSVVSYQDDSPPTSNQQLATCKILNTTQLLNCSLLDHPILKAILSPLVKEGSGEI
jgi:methylase of polypeptide subunit release factors